MIQFDELRQNLEHLNPDLADLSVALSIKNKKDEVAELDQKVLEPDFWNDMENAQKTTQNLASLKSVIKKFDALNLKYEDAVMLTSLAIEEKDESLFGECLAAYKEVKAEIETMRLSTMLSGEYDKNNAILTFHAGAGGTEAQDWAEMLYRMYTRWAERSGFKYTLLDYLDGDEAGIKSASIRIEGENAYGYLKCEAGVHRLVRISPFDSSGRRHTSFAALEVVPDIDDDDDIEIRSEDLKIDTFRSGGAGGQHVNTTDSAIRITHIPTGIIVSCQNERSQHQNRDTAMRMLKGKLIEIKEREHYDKIEDIKGGQSQIGWGNQIRSYVFMPYTMAKDHRTNFETGNIGAVMDGEIDDFINAYLKAAANGTLKKVN